MKRASLSQKAIRKSAYYKTTEGKRKGFCIITRTIQLRRFPFMQYLLHIVVETIFFQCHAFSHRLIRRAAGIRVEVCQNSCGLRSALIPVRKKQKVSVSHSPIAVLDKAMFSL
jgi:hypothetical protein